MSAKSPSKMKTYCWGEQLIPRLILSESSSAVTIEVDGIPRTIPNKSVWGRCEWPFADGERVRVQNGYYWSPGRVAGVLSVALDRGETVRIWNLDAVRQINESVQKQIGILDIELKLSQEQNR